MCPTRAKCDTSLQSAMMNQNKWICGMKRSKSQKLHRETYRTGDCTVQNCTALLSSCTFRRYSHVHSDFGRYPPLQQRRQVISGLLALFNLGVLVTFLLPIVDNQLVAFVEAHRACELNLVSAAATAKPSRAKQSRQGRARFKERVDQYAVQ